MYGRQSYGSQLYGGWPDVATQAGSFTGDANLKGTVAFTFASNASLKTAVPGTYSGDASLKRTNISGSFTGNSSLKILISSTFTSNANLKKNVTGTFTGNSVLTHNTGRYGRGNYAVLPTDNQFLETRFQEDDYTAVALNDNVYTGQSANLQYAIFQFKNRFSSNTQKPTFTWYGRSSLAPSLSAVFLQVFNITSGNWETLDSNNAAAENTKFSLSGTISGTISDYYDGNRWTSCRIYQLSI